MTGIKRERENEGSNLPRNFKKPRGIHEFNGNSMKMEELMLKFPHLPEKLFKKLDSESLFKCREVARSWENIIGRRNYPWLRIVNIPTILKERNSYLHLAAETGQIEAFKTTINQEEDENIRNEHDETPFLVACKNGRFKIVQLLLKNTDLKINFNAEDNWYGFTAFHFACQRGHFDVVKILLETTAGLNIDLKAKTKHDGNSVFHLACTNGHSAVVKILMKNAAALSIDLNAENINGMPPFFLACHYDSTDLINIFMENAANLGIDLNAEASGVSNRTGFHLACAKGYANVVNIFMKNAANLSIDLNRKSRNGYTAFNMACLCNQSEVVKILKDNAAALGINLNNNKPYM